MFLRFNNPLIKPSKLVSNSRDSPPASEIVTLSLLFPLLSNGFLKRVEPIAFMCVTQSNAPSALNVYS